MSKWLLAWILFVFMDVAAYHSVPLETRLANRWALIPGAGFILAAEYHFGNGNLRRAS